MTPAELASSSRPSRADRSGPPFTGPDAVNTAMIRHWCEAMGDTLPVYTDEAAARASVHGGIIAPPAMLQVWDMWGYRPRPEGGTSAQDRLFRLLERHGFTSVVATDCEQEYHRELRPGDVVTVDSVIESVSDEKTTALGVGHFVTSRLTYRDGDGGLVATQLWRMLKFKPGTGRSASSGQGRAPAAAPTLADQGQRLVVRCPQGASPPDPALLVVRGAPPSAPTDVRPLRIVRVATGGGQRPGHDLQLRREPLPPGSGLRLSRSRSG